ncbi:MAG: 2-amino-4-hydroxy-6-hydroxymethyldihydropteridine diphosphokinase [Epsilonproteobacteria bacterium]|nr:2-amino-4-hydroxy-6-hydroxymethyldihydropteridine diphosphokinase [Campylobacterota bacterium]
MGSNLGSKKENIAQAIDCIGKTLYIKRASSLYKTGPTGYIDQPDFYNRCITVETELLPFSLLAFLKNTEIGLGRKHSIRWGPRLIDIDILLFDIKLIYSRRLAVPHKEMLRRKFAMLPACEIAGDWIYPGLHKTVKALYRERREALAIQKIIKVR